MLFHLAKGFVVQARLIVLLQLAAEISKGRAQHLFLLGDLRVICRKVGVRQQSLLGKLLQ